MTQQTVDLGINHKTNRQFTDAISIFGDLLKNDKKDSVLLNYRGECYQAIGRYSDALKDFEQAVKCDPMYIPAYAGNCSVLCDLDQVEKALKVLERVPSGLTDTDEFGLASAVCFTSTGQYQEAIRICDQILQTNAESVKALVQKVETLYRYEQFDEALKWCESIIEINPFEPRPYFRRAVISIFHRDETESSLPDISKFIELDPENYRGYGLRAYANQKISGTSGGNSISTLQDVNRALDMIHRPQSADFWIFWVRAAVWDSTGQNRYALKDYDKAIKLCPSTTPTEQSILVELLSQNADCYASMGDNKNALRAYGDLLKIDPSNIAALEKQAALLFENDKYSDALKGFRTIMALAPEEWHSYALASHCSYYLKDYDAANFYVDHALLLESEDQYVYWLKGIALDKLGQWPEAALNINRAYKLGGPFGGFEREIIQKAQEFNASNSLVQSWKKAKNRIER